MESLKKLYEVACTIGLKLPHAYDAPSKKPSARLLFCYLTFLVAIASVVALHWHPSMVLATWTAIGFYVVCTALYMLKNLTKAKFDFDDQEISLSDSSNKKKEKNTK